MKFAGTASECWAAFHLAWNKIWQWFHSRKKLVLCNAVPGSPTPRESLENGNWDDNVHMLKEGLRHAGVNMLIVLPKIVIIKTPHGQSLDYFEAFTGQMTHYKNWGVFLIFWTQRKMTIQLIFGKFHLSHANMVV